MTGALPPPPVINWSYSALNAFENCPRKFWATKIGKVVSDANQYNMAGNEDHDAIEIFHKKGIPLPERMANLVPMMQKLRAAPGEKYVEFQMTLRTDFSVTTWKDYKNAWVRGAGDWINVNGSLATYLDWKSGKPRKDIEDQVDLTALLIFAHFPNVHRVQGGMFYFNHGKLAPHAVDRADAPRLWNGFINRVKELERAKLEDNWPVNPNPLCGWCPYKACPHNTMDERLAREAAKAGG